MNTVLLLILTAKWKLFEDGVKVQWEPLASKRENIKNVDKFLMFLMALCKVIASSEWCKSPRRQTRWKRASCVGFVWRGKAHKQTTRELQQDVYGDVR